MNTTPRVDWASRRDASIDDYFADAGDIWGRDRFERTAVDLWLNVIAHTNHVVKNARLRQPRQVIDSLADTVMYLLSFLNQCKYSDRPEDETLKLTVPPSDIIWNKYPGICPTCFDSQLEPVLASEGVHDSAPTPCHLFSAERLINNLATQSRKPIPCTCPAQSTFTGERHHFWNMNNDYLIHFRRMYADTLSRQGEKISSVTELEGMFAAIFDKSCYIFSLERMALFIQEEVGDASEAIKDTYTYYDNVEPWSHDVAERRTRRLQEEIADVFSCLFSILLKIKFDCESLNGYVAELSGHNQIDLVEEVSFADLIWSKYGRSKTTGEVWEYLRCPRCEFRPCKCPRHFLNDRASFAAADLVSAIA